MTTSEHHWCFTRWRSLQGHKRYAYGEADVLCYLCREKRTVKVHINSSDYHMLMRYVEKNINRFFIGGSCPVIRVEVK